MPDDNQNDNQGNNDQPAPSAQTIVINAEDLPAVAQGSSVAATKEFAVNATGNLFVASTLNAGGTGTGGNTGLTEEAQKAFSQVSVFFAAMTKAMNESGKNLYDFDALNNLIQQSGLFVNMTKSDVQYNSTSFGLTFGSQLIQALLGLSGDLSSIANALTSLISEVGKQGISISADSTSKTSKVGTIVFVCEYLLGAVSITPIAIYADVKSNKANFSAGPCFKTSRTKTSWNLSKEVYLFVPPEFMSQAVTMNQAMSNPDFEKMVQKMISDINGDNNT